MPGGESGEADLVTSSDSSSSAGSLVNTVKTVQVQLQVAAGGLAPSDMSRNDAVAARVAWLDAPSFAAQAPLPANAAAPATVAANAPVSPRHASPSKAQASQNQNQKHQVLVQANPRQVALPPQLVAAAAAAAPMNGANGSARDSRLSAPAGISSRDRDREHVPRAVRAFLKSADNRAKLAHLPALVKGYLTRRLLRSEKVKELIRTIQDTAQLMVSLVDVDAARVTREDTLKDSMLQERLYAQVCFARVTKTHNTSRQLLKRFCIL